MPREKLSQLSCQRFMSKFHRSKLNVANFCNRENISVATFYYRKQRAGSAPQKHESTVGFIPLRLSKPITQESTTDFSLKFPSGLVLQIPMQFPTEMIADLIRILKEVGY